MIQRDICLEQIHLIVSILQLFIETSFSISTISISLSNILYTQFIVYHWRNKIVTEEQTKKLVGQIKRGKSLRFTEKTEQETKAEQQAILKKSWKPWIVGDFEKKKSKVQFEEEEDNNDNNSSSNNNNNNNNNNKPYHKNQKRKVKQKLNNFQSLIPKSLVNTPEYRASMKASIPELLLKRANIEKDLKVLKSIVKKAGKDVDFNVKHYSSRYKRERQLSMEELNKRKNNIDVNKTRKEIYNGRKLNKLYGKADYDDDVGKVNVFGGIHKSTFQTYRRKTGRRPKQTLASASTHHDAERKLQQSFVLRYMANGPNSTGTTEAKNALLHCYKVLRRGNEYMDLKKNPDIHVLKLHEFLSVEENNNIEPEEESIERYEMEEENRPAKNKENNDNEVNVREQEIVTKEKENDAELFSTTKTTDWVIGTQCKQLIQLQTPRTFDKDAYFRLHLGICKTVFLAWDVDSKNLQQSMEIFKDYLHDLCDIKVTKTERSSIKHYEWEITMTSRTPSIPLLQVWTPDKSPLQFSVNWVYNGELASKTKYEKQPFSDAKDMPHARRIITPKRVTSPKSKDRMSPSLATIKSSKTSSSKKRRGKTSPSKNDRDDNESDEDMDEGKENARVKIQKALQVGAFKEVSNLSMEVMEKNGISPAPIRIFRSALEKVTLYPRRSDFKVEIKLDTPPYIVVGSKLRVNYSYRHLIEQNKEHDVLDWIGIFYITNNNKKNKRNKNNNTEDGVTLVAKANVPEGNEGTLLFDGISEKVGTYEIRYCLKGSDCQVGKPRRYIASHPLVQLNGPKHVSINGVYEIPVSYQYILGGAEMTIFDNDEGDWLGIYPLQAPIHDLFGQVDHKKPIKVFHLKSCNGMIKFQGMPRFPGKYEIRVESGLYKDVILGTFGPITIDAVSEIPTFQGLIDKREINFYISGQLRRIIYDRSFFYEKILPHIVQLCDERRVLFSIVDMHLEKLNLDKRSYEESIDLGINKLIECRPYGLYFLPNIYGGIPRILSDTLIDDFPWLKSYDETKPGCGISIGELELMIGLIIPQFQHDIIAANSIACLQDINYKSSLSTRRKSTNNTYNTNDNKVNMKHPLIKNLILKDRETRYGIYLKEIEDTDAQFNVRERVLCTDALLIKDYARPKSLKAPLIRCFRSLINRKFSKKQTPDWLSLHENFTTMYFKTFLQHHIDIIEDSLYDKLSMYAFGQSSRILYFKPLMLTSETSGGGCTTVFAKWMEKILPKGARSVSHFKHGRVGLCTVIAISFECQCTSKLISAIRKILFDIKRLFHLKESIPTHLNDMLETLYAWMGKVECYGRIILIFDGVDHLEETFALSHIEKEIEKIEMELHHKHHHHHKQKNIDPIEMHETSDIKKFFALLRRNLPRNVRVLFSIARASESYTDCSESWNFVGIPRLVEKYRIPFVEHYRKILLGHAFKPLKITEKDEDGIVIDPYAPFKSPDSLLMKVRVDEYDNLDIEEPVEKAPEKSPAVVLLEKFIKKYPPAKHILALLLVSTNGVTELEMTYATLEMKAYHDWLEIKDHLSPIIAEKICGVWYILSFHIRAELISLIPIEELLFARSLLLKTLKSKTYKALNRIADVLPPLIKEKQLLNCILQPPIFEKLVCEERHSSLLHYLRQLKLNITDYIRLLRRSIEEYYNVGYMGKHGKEDKVYNYHLAARPKPVGTLNVTVAEYRRCVARQLVGIMSLLYSSYAFHEAESAAICAICLNLGVRNTEDIINGNLVELESCENSVIFLAKSHVMLDVNIHMRKATTRNFVILHEKTIKKKEKKLKQIFQQLKEKNVSTIEAMIVIRNMQGRRRVLKHARRRRRTHSATRMLIKEAPIIKKRLMRKNILRGGRENNEVLKCPYI